MNLEAVKLKQEDSDSCLKVGKESIFKRFMSASSGNKNDFYFARIISSWVNKEGALPRNLGLGEDDFQQLLVKRFGGCEDLISANDGDEFEKERIPEWEDLVGLMLEYRANDDVSEEWIAQIVAAACMGLDHLWQDLGLWSRTELSEVLSINFPELAKRNNKDMKWKKFLYKQLCERDGTYVCRAPSCDVCADYQLCFGPEE